MTFVFIVNRFRFYVISHIPVFMFISMSHVISAMIYLFWQRNYFILMIALRTNKLIQSISLSGNLKLAKSHVENHYGVHQTARTAKPNPATERGGSSQIRTTNDGQSKFLSQRSDFQHSPLATDFGRHLENARSHQQHQGKFNKCIFQKQRDGSFQQIASDFKICNSWLGGGGNNLYIWKNPQYFKWSQRY